MRILLTIHIYEMLFKNKDSPFYRFKLLFNKHLKESPDLHKKNACVIRTL